MNAFDETGGQRDRDDFPSRDAAGGWTWPERAADPPGAGSPSPRAAPETGEPGEALPPPRRRRKAARRRRPPLPRSAIGRRRAIAAAVGIAILAAAGWFALGPGTGSERTFTAQQVTEGVSARGVEMTLLAPLVSDDESREVFAVEVEPLEGAPEGGESSAPLTGSIAVYPDVEGADDGLANCQAAAEFVCYQAQNVIIILEGGGIQAQRLGVAIRQFAAEQ